MPTQHAPLCCKRIASHTSSPGKTGENILSRVNAQHSPSNTETTHTPKPPRTSQPRAADAAAVALSKYWKFRGRRVPPPLTLQQGAVSPCPVPSSMIPLLCDTGRQMCSRFQHHQSKEHNTGNKKPLARRLLCYVCHVEVQPRKE